MTMDKSALEHLENILTADATVERVATETNGSVVPLPCNVELNDLESYMPQRRRFRGRMNTHLIEQFCQFTNQTARMAGTRNGAHFKSPCFIDAERMTATAFFNLGDVHEPGHGDHTATVSLTKTQPYTELLQINGQTLSQKTLAEWMEDWREYLEAIDSEGTPLPLMASIAAIRRVTISAKSESTSEQQNFGTRQSSMAEVEAKNKDTLPAFLNFTTEAFHGLDSHTFTLRVSLLTGGDSPKFSVRLVRLESALEEMAVEFRERLEEGLSAEDTETFVGTFKP